MALFVFVEFFYIENEPKSGDHVYNIDFTMYSYPFLVLKLMV